MSKSYFSEQNFGKSSPRKKKKHRSRHETKNCKLAAQVRLPPKTYLDFVQLPSLWQRVISFVSWPPGEVFCFFGSPWGTTIRLFKCLHYGLKVWGGRLLYM
jgi:hypothetical protein